MSLPNSHGLPTIEVGGETRILGHVPVKQSRNVSVYGAIDLLPESEWVEFDLTTDPGYAAAVPILDQNQKGACNGHAAASSLMAARWLAGQTPVKLSPWFVYSILCGGWDQGSNIGDALRLLSEKGTCRYEAVPYATINPNRLTAANYEEAKNFKIEIGNPARSFAELMTLTQRRTPSNFSIHVGNGFDNLDSEGCPPARSGAGNHAVMGGIGAKKMKNGRWAIKWQNSWGTRWGQSGYAWFHEGHIANQSYFESYGVSATVDTPGDPTNPPLAV